MNLTRAQLDQLKCRKPGCGCNEAILAGACHRNAGVTVIYREGVISIACKQCSKPVVDIAVAPSEPEKKTVAVGGIWLRTGSDDKSLEVLAEVNGEWRLCFSEHTNRLEVTISHIIEPIGIEKAKRDPLTETKA